MRPYRESRLSQAVVILAALIVAGCASVPLADPSHDSASKTFTVPPGKVLIYVVRNGGYISGAYQVFTVGLDGLDHGKLADRTYFVFTVDPGAHSIRAAGENQEQVRIEATAGGIYFVGLRSSIGIVTARVNASLLSADEGKTAVLASKMAAEAPR